MISSIDNTLVNFKEVEIEEIVAFKAYLRHAIASFALMDSSSSSSLIPFHTRPNKENVNSRIEDKKAKKVLVENPHIALTSVLNRGKTQEVALPKTSTTNEKTWVIVARNGHKKARVVVGDKI